jgi:hypothetical protein
MVPKDGGNRLHGDLFLGWVNSNFVGWTPVQITNPLDGSPLTVFNLQPAFFGLTPQIYQTNGRRRHAQTPITTSRLRLRLGFREGHSCSPVGPSDTRWIETAT